MESINKDRTAGKAVLLSEKETAEKLLSVKNVVITAHTNPDGDALGSSLGLMYFLRSQGVNAVVCIDDEVPSDFTKFMYGTDEIIGFEKLQEIQKPDMLVIVDAALDNTGRVPGFFDVPILNIDHHISNPGCTDWLCLDAEAAAAAEIVCRIWHASGYPISKEAALNLYTGIATDSGFFKYSNTKPKTLRVAADLLEAGADPELVSSSLGSKPFHQIKERSVALSGMSITSDSKISYLFLTNDSLNGMESTTGIIESLAGVSESMVALFIREVQPNVCKVSMRSKTVNVSNVASSLGGGGHIKAAGCTVNDSLMNTAKLVMDTIYQEIGAAEPKEN